ncbi:MAG: ATP-dependent protease ATPase subunit HslU [Fimbriimonadaceae bacterium]|nr:ATP-dependent protease ATPase subunit HslU [Fimbriimonadaceae bacterium]
MPLSADHLTPAQIVAELDRHIVGQRAAKRAVAIALRNRYRRRALEATLAEEVIPKNILMIGATGVGKTEIARRLAKLAQAPFIKVEATKFTEVGYVGRDVESMVRDIVDAALRLVEAQQYATVETRAAAAAVERLLDTLVPGSGGDGGTPPHLRAAREWATKFGLDVPPEPPPAVAPPPGTREAWRQRLEAGELQEHEVEIEVSETRSPMLNIFGGQGEETVRLEDALGGMLPKQTRRRRLTVPEALVVLTREEAEKLLDRDHVVREAISRAEHDGIIFVDELDKICGRDHGHGPDVSREGVQRDILPVVEGTTVVTKYGPVSTKHMLFIAAGAFHVSKPSDLIPELQGRFPIRVELENLTTADLRRVLAEPEHSLLRQYAALLETEGVTVEFRDDAIDELAAVASSVNASSENIGARRLHTILEALLEELSFAAPDVAPSTVTVTREYVRQRLGPILGNPDLTRYIL